jgi:hypothetical protein
MTDTARHLRWEAIADCLRRGVPVLERIEVTPRVDVFIDPDGRSLGLRIHAQTGDLPPSPLAEISVRTRYFAGSSVVDSLRAWNTLLQRVTLLSAERQAGLIAELCFLEFLAQKLSWTGAVAAWKGPFCEEHDFVLPGCDVEVKATVREQRIHQIGSLWQCLPKEGRRLCFLSVQLTTASNAEGESLAQRVRRVITAAEKESTFVVEEIQARLKEGGWRIDHAPLHLQRYLPRADQMNDPGGQHLSGDHSVRGCAIGSRACCPS